MTDQEKRRRNGLVPGAWLRGGPIDGVSQPSLSTVLVDTAEADAAGVDLEAEGFTQVFSGRDVAVPSAELFVVLTTPYDLELVRQRDFDPTQFELPAFMAGTFPDRHPDVWLSDITQKGELMVIVVPGLAKVQGAVSWEDLRPAWCAFARVVQPAR